MADHKGATHHRSAAEHHEHAARHHKKAATHHEAGNHEKAGHHANAAAGPWLFSDRCLVAAEPEIRPTAMDADNVAPD